MNPTINIVRDKLVGRVRHEFRNFILQILLPIFFVIFFLYITTFIQDPSESISLASLPTLSILGIGSLTSIGLIFYRKLEGYEKRIFLSIYLFLLANFIGEIIYTYQQLVMGISVPYPSVADIPYLSANIILAYHLYSNLISIIKERRFSRTYLILVSVVVSIVPIYFASMSMYTSGINIVTDTVTYLTDLGYYTLDIILLAPSIIILLNFNKNDPFVFQWLLVTLGIIVLVAGDLGYTYSALISEQFIEFTHWIWNIFYAVAYILFLASIFWYIKIKRILYDKDVDSIRRKGNVIYDSPVKYEDSDYSESKGNEVYDKIFDDEKIVRTVQEIFQDVDNDIDILLAIKSVSRRDVIDRILNIIAQNVKKKRPLNFRILQHVQERRYDNLSLMKGHYKNIFIRNSQRSTIFETIIFIIDYEYLFVIEINPSGLDDKNVCKAVFTNNDVKLLVYINMFERSWLSESANQITSAILPIQRY